MDELSPTHNRRQKRSNVCLTAALEAAGQSFPVILRNLSEDGALVQASELPAEDCRVVFRRQGLSVPGRIVWSHSKVAGVAFESPLSPSELLRHVPVPGPRANGVQTQWRPGFAARPLTPAERALIERWATESPGHLGE
jgi:hypothetical protein